MRWIVDLDGHGGDAGLAWACAFMAGYDTSAVAWFRIDCGRGRLSRVYGRCHYPTRETKAYCISCHVRGPFPTTFRTRKPPIYRRPDGTWPYSEGNPDGTPVARNLPPGWALGAFCRDAASGKDWVRVVGRTELRDIDEGVVWIVAHEAFHCLRRTRQVPGRNTEIEADAFADRMLGEFRAEREEALATPGEVLGSPGAQVATKGRCRMPKQKKGTTPKGKQPKKSKRADATPPEPTAAETAPATDLPAAPEEPAVQAGGAEAPPVEQTGKPESDAKAKPRKGKKARASENGPSAELDALRAKAAEAKDALTVATNEASALRLQATGVEAAAKRAYAEALAPYRAACRKAGATCEFPGVKAPSTLPRARFLIERHKDGLRVAVAGRPETEETISGKQLGESVWRAAREYCQRHFGDQLTDGRCRGLGLRFRSALERA